VWLNLAVVRADVVDVGLDRVGPGRACHVGKRRVRDLHPVGVGQAVYWSRVFGDHDKWDLAYVSFSADYPDPDNWLPDFFETNGGYNSGIAQYSNESFDTKVAQALSDEDEAHRLTLWQEAESIMLEDAPAIFLFNDEMFILKNERVKGIVGTAMDLYIPGDMFLANIYLD